MDPELVVMNDLLVFKSQDSNKVRVALRLFCHGWFRVAKVITQCIK